MPNFDPKDLSQFYRVGDSPIFGTGQRGSSVANAFGNWLITPSPTTEREVNQALAAAGRPPLFAATARYTNADQASLGHSISQAQARQLSSTTYLVNLARSAIGRQPMAPGGAFRAASGIVPDLTWRTASSWPNQFVQSRIASTDDPAKMLKHIDQTLGSMNRTEHRMLFLTEQGARGTAHVGTAPIWSRPAIFNRPPPGGFPRAGVAAPFGVSAAAGLNMWAQAHGITLPSFVPGAPPPAGGGGGGGGGAGGYIGAGAGGFIFGGGLGPRLGRLARGGVIGAVGGEALELAYRWPLHLLTGLPKEFYDKGAPFAQWRTELADVTRLQATMSGRPGLRSGLENILLPPLGRSGEMEDFLRSQGVDPEKITQLHRLGIGPQQTIDIWRRLGGTRAGLGMPAQINQLLDIGNLQRSGAFVGTPEGTVEALMRASMKFGITTPGQAQGLPQTVSQYLQTGRMEGADVTDLLHSIDTTISSLAKTGVRLDLSQTAGWTDFLSRVRQVDLPMAQAGILGGQAVAGFQASAQRPLRNPVTATAWAQLINSVNWNDPRVVKQFFGDNPNSYQQMILRSLQDPNARMAPSTLQLAPGVLSASPQARHAVVNFAKGLFGGRGVLGQQNELAWLMQVFGTDDPTVAWAAMQAEGRMGRPARGPGHRPRGAARPMRGTVSETELEAGVAAMTLTLDGMRKDFDSLGQYIIGAAKVLDTFASAVAAARDAVENKPMSVAGAIGGVAMAGNPLVGLGLGTAWLAKKGAEYLPSWMFGGGGGGGSGATAPKPFSITDPSTWLPSWLGGGGGVRTGTRSSGKMGGITPTIRGERGGAVRMAHWLDAHGYTAQAAAAVMGNAQFESSFNPNAGLGTAFQGLFQEDASRWRGGGFETQMERMDAELERRLPGFKHRTDDPGDLASLFDRKFEVSAGTTRGGRMNAARAYASEWNKYKSEKLAMSAPIGGAAALMPGWGLMDAISGFIIHHTGGGKSVEDVVNVFKQRNVGSNFIIDKAGKLTRVLPSGAAGHHIQTGWGSLGEGKSNRNMLGVEVIAADDRDVNKRQINTALKLVNEEAAKHGFRISDVFGHGEVNPGHRQASEGMTIVNALRSERGYWSSRDLGGLRAFKPASDTGGSGTEEPGRGGSAGASYDHLREAFAHLVGSVRETAEHLHELGHGARRANSGISGGQQGSPNPRIAPTSDPASAPAYP